MERSRLFILITFVTMAATLSTFVAAFYSQLRVRTMQSELDRELPTVDFRKPTEVLNQAINEQLKKMIEMAPERAQAAALEQRFKDVETRSQSFNNKRLDLGRP